jgi:uroporphyrinogen-III synthase
MSLIPFVIPPLHTLRVLITRPAEQATQLAAMIAAHGGEPRLFPSIAIEAVTPDEPLTEHAFDWTVFLSANAVRHGAPLIQPATAGKVVAIGQATARALREASWTVHLIPQAPYTTEALLRSSAFAVTANERVLIVRGVGGRDALDRALLERGATLHTLRVYRRVAASHTETEREELEREWLEPGFDVVTATSVETLRYLHEQLGPVGRAELAQTPLLVVSQRIEHAAREMNLWGPCVLAPAPDDASLVGALSNWFARAR